MSYFLDFSFNSVLYFTNQSLINSEEMKQRLDDYCAEIFGDIVKILRPEKRLGLIAGKNYGGRQATGDVVVFLDAHIEATEGWLVAI